VTWERLFERAAAYDVDERAVREAVATVRAAGDHDDDDD
jgi:hypothetical protein